MAQNQVNLTLSDALLAAARDYSKKFGYKNVQDLATECLRQTVFEKDYDEDFTPKEIELIEKFIDVTLSRPELLSTEKELDKVLLGK
jgi:hypothetical protein